MNTKGAKNCRYSIYYDFICSSKPKRSSYDPNNIMFFIFYFFVACVVISNWSIHQVWQFDRPFKVGHPTVLNVEEITPSMGWNLLTSEVVLGKNLHGNDPLTSKPPKTINPAARRHGSAGLGESRIGQNKSLCSRTRSSSEAIVRWQQDHHAHRRFINMNHIYIYVYRYEIIIYLYRYITLEWYQNIYWSDSEKLVTDMKT